MYSEGGWRCVPFVRADRSAHGARYSGGALGDAGWLCELCGMGEDAGGQRFLRRKAGAADSGARSERTVGVWRRFWPVGRSERDLAPADPARLAAADTVYSRT